MICKTCSECTSNGFHAFSLLSICILSTIKKEQATCILTEKTTLLSLTKSYERLFLDTFLSKISIFTDDPSGRSKDIPPMTQCITPIIIGQTRKNRFVTYIGKHGTCATERTREYVVKCKNIISLHKYFLTVHTY